MTYSEYTTTSFVREDEYIIGRTNKTRQDHFILIRLHRVQYGENINKIDSQSVFCGGSWRSIQ